ncbi:hypothetical protein BC332_25150 [Capsicum chinense]|nr:hypothetical protein BC332_25150 [Capsicum chinense]
MNYQKLPIQKVKKNSQFGHHHQQQNHMNTTEQKTSELVTVDGERELELETLLKASAYILGASGLSIMYKIVLEDGTTLAVRRIGESGMERFTDFENRERDIFVAAYTEILSEGLDVHSCDFDAKSQRARYASLLLH